MPIEYQIKADTKVNWLKKHKNPETFVNLGFPEIAKHEKHFMVIFFLKIFK